MFILACYGDSMAFGEHDDHVHGGDHDNDEDRRWTEFEIQFMSAIVEHLRRIEGKLDAIYRKERQLQEGQNIMAQDLTQLTDAVAQEGTVVDSAITLLNGIAAALQEAIANGADPAAVQAVVDSISAKSGELAAAVAANTPAA